jgi:hypothetical protein
MVLMPLVALAEQKSSPQIDKATVDHTGASDVEITHSDFTKLGVSKVDAIFILRQENKNLKERET